MSTKNDHGFGTIILVLFITIFATFILASIQTRLFLSLRRGQSETDKLVSLYNAETRINDYLGRALGRFPLPANSTETLPDGTILKIDSTGAVGSEKVTVSADRPYAHVSLELNRSGAVATSDGAEIILLLDCSGSMDTYYGDYEDGPLSRYQIMEDATRAFVDKLENVVATTPGAQVKLGLATFEVRAGWVTAGTIQLRPDTNDQFANIFQTMDDTLRFGFKRKRGSSSNCTARTDDGQAITGGGTNLGAALVHGLEYYNNHPTTAKKILILVTDGEPSSSNAHPYCPPLIDCHDDDSYSCEWRAVAYLRCGIFTPAQRWWEGPPEYFGARDPSIDVYSITIDVHNTDVEKILHDNSAYYQNILANHAASFNNALNNTIFNKIISATNSFRIQRIIPQ